MDDNSAQNKSQDPNQPLVDNTQNQENTPQEPTESNADQATVNISQDVSPLSPPPSTPLSQPTPQMQEPSVNETNTPVNPPEPQTSSVVTTEPKRGKKLGRGKIIATVLGILLLVGGVSTGAYLVTQQQDVRIGAWDCSQYTFDVSQDGEVSVTNNSSRNEPGQQATVKINDAQAGTFNVPALAPGDSAQIGIVNVPEGGFAWEVDGTVDCSNSGSYEPTVQDCTVENPSADLTGQITDWTLGGVAKANVVNSSNCEYQIGMASYKKFDEVIDNQIINDSDTKTIGPAQTVNLEVSLPDCATQIDVFWGDLIQDLNGNRYGDRLIDDLHVGDQDYCSTNPTPSPTPTTSPSPTPSPTPSNITAECSNVVAYDTEWNQLTQTQLNNLEAGDIVRFAVKGTASSGSFDQAKFVINGDGSRDPVTDQRPSTGEFYDDYEIPDNVNDFEVDAVIHHATLGWL